MLVLDLLVIAEEHLELQPGVLVDFWRKPATKYESGWRGPATVMEPRTDSSLATASATVSSSIQRSRQWDSDQPWPQRVDVPGSQTSTQTAAQHRRSSREEDAPKTPHQVLACGGSQTDGDLEVSWCTSERPVSDQGHSGDVSHLPYMANAAA